MITERVVDPELKARVEIRIAKLQAELDAEEARARKVLWDAGISADSGDIEGYYGVRLSTKKTVYLNKVIARFRDVIRGPRTEREIVTDSWIQAMDRKETPFLNSIKAAYGIADKDVFTAEDLKHYDRLAVKWGQSE